MTWESRLFAELEELEQQAEGMFAAERDLEVAERARAEYARVRMAARLMAAQGAEVSLRVTGVGEVAGRLARVAEDWCLLDSGDQAWIIRLPAVAVARGLPPGAVPPEAWPVTARLGLGSALRGLAESAARCTVRLLDQTTYPAQLGRVGHDFVEATVGEGSGPVVVAFSSIAAVHARRD